MTEWTGQIRAGDNRMSVTAAQITAGVETLNDALRLRMNKRDMVQAIYAAMACEQNRATGWVEAQEQAREVAL